MPPPVAGIMGGLIAGLVAFLRSCECVFWLIFLVKPHSEERLRFYQKWARLSLFVSALWGGIFGYLGENSLLVIVVFLVFFLPAIHFTYQGSLLMAEKLFKKPKKCDITTE